jgi:hypothetical protein
MTHLKNFHWEKKIWDLLIEQWMIHQTDLEKALESQIQMAKNWFNLRIWEILFLVWKITESQYKKIQNELLLNAKKWISKSVWDLAIDLWYIDAVSLYTFLEETGTSLTDGEKLVQKWIISRENLLFFLEELKINPKYEWKKILHVLLSNWIITQAVYEQYSKTNWNEWGFDFT